MMIRRWDLLFLIFTVFVPSFLFAQKVERERRVPGSEFPAFAHQYLLDSFPGDVKWKFYEEISKDGRTYEAKGRVMGYPYSVEFFPDGSLMDVEKTIRLSELPSAVRADFERDLSDTYQKFRILRVQIQFSSMGTRFEIEVKTKSEKKWRKYQYLIDEEGFVLDREVMLSKPIDFIFY